MAVFDIEDLSFTYPNSQRPALIDVNVSVGPGEYVCICGRSGCGKTTLLRHLKSSLTPYGSCKGRVLFHGSPLGEVGPKEQSAEIGFVMQNPDAQIVTDKVWHELAFGLENLGVGHEDMRLRVAEMTDYFGIAPWFHKETHDLSGGQKQLLNLASVMAMHPSVLILDEPTAQLDPTAAFDFLCLIEKINRELGTAVIITEHRLEDVIGAADTVVAMEEGGIIAQGPPRNVASMLYEIDDDMIFALPTPIRVYYDIARNMPPLNAEAQISILNSEPPMTVREGRIWLSEYVKRERPSATSLAERHLDEYSKRSIALECKNVWFRYGKSDPDVLRGVDIEVPEGSLYAVMGGNGAGKSTLLKCACDIIRPYRGDIRIFGKKIAAMKGEELFNACIAMLPQDPTNLFVKSTVQEDLEEMVDSSHLASFEKQTEIETVARICAVEHLLGMHPFDLSGGEQQRAALAKVLLTKPRILMLDEPTKGMDHFSKREFAHILGQLKAQGTTIIMVSHDVEFCASYADIVSMCFDGTITASNTPRRFFSQNSFYTTAASRMSRDVFANAVTVDDVVELCLS